MTKKQQIISLVSGVVLVIVLILIGVFFLREPEQVVSTEEPVDVAVDFYKQWSEELVATTTNPYESGLSESPILSKELRNKLKDAKGQSADIPDPVLCQTIFDSKFSTRKVFEGENEVQILITSKDKTQTGQAVYTVLKYKEGWFINDIKCSPGEFGEEREFTFDREGYLLKGSILESLEKEEWYLVFEEDGQPGHSAKLMFNGDSVCLNKGKDEATCSLDKFPAQDATKVSVKGQMSEAGVEVKKLDFIKK